MNHRRESSHVRTLFAHDFVQLSMLSSKLDTGSLWIVYRISREGDVTRASHVSAEGCYLQEDIPILSAEVVGDVSVLRILYHSFFF